MTVVDKKTRYQQLKAAGLCVECGKLPVTENSVRCEQCREMHKTVNRMYRVRLYYKRQENRECVCCGVKLPPDRYYVHCEKCLEKRKVYQKEYYARRKKAE